MRRQFHRALACSFVPVFFVPLVLGIALHALGTPPRNGEERWWRRGIFALAAFDVASAIALIAVTARAAAGMATRPVVPEATVAAMAERICARPELAEVLAPPYAGLFFGAVLLLWLQARLQRAPGGGAWIVVVAPLMLAFGSSFVLWPLACPDSGLSDHALVAVEFLSPGLLLGVGGAFAAAWLARRVSPLVLSEHTRPVLETAGTAVLYIWSTLFRLVPLMAVWVMLDPDSELTRSRPIDQLVTLLQDPVDRISVAFAVVVLAPISEEILFRGIVLPGLARQMNLIGAVLLCSLLFALLHGPSHGPVGVVGVMALSLVLCWVRIRTGGLRGPMLTHAIHNGLVLAVVTWASGLQGS